MFSKLRSIVAGLMAVVLALSAGTALADDAEGTIKAIKDAGMLRAVHRRVPADAIQEPKRGNGRP
jgi:hypothetical protein